MDERIREISVSYMQYIECLYRARNYKDEEGNYRPDIMTVRKSFPGDTYCVGELLKINTENETEDPSVCFCITNVKEYSSFYLCVGYWVWSTMGQKNNGVLKSIDDLPDDAHEGEYYVIRKNKNTPIKDYKYYERVGNKWKPMESYWR